MNCLYCTQEIQAEFTWQSLFHKTKQPLLCTTCMQKLSLLIGSLCLRCSRPLERIDAAFVVDGICRDCIHWEDNYGFIVAHRSIYSYNDVLKDLFALYKFRGDYILSQFFADMIKVHLNVANVDVIVPLPISASRYKERGFNQVEAILDQAGIAYSSVLKMHDRADKQSHKNRKERMESKNQFFVENISQIYHKNILVIDDIYTTGTTIYHATQVCQQAGASNVTSFSIARG